MELRYRGGRPQDYEDTMNDRPLRMAIPMSWQSWFLVIAVAFIAIGCTDDKATERTASVSKLPLDASAAPDGEEDPTEENRQLILGVWEDDYKGKRRLTFRNDGTATMIVEPSGMNSLFAARLRFEETWSIADGHLTMRVTGGEPAGRVKLILQTMGDSTRQKILALDEEFLRLLDENGDTEYTWRRVTPETNAE